MAENLNSNQKNLDKMVKWISSILFVVFLIAIGVIKYTVEKFTWKWAIILSVSIFVVFLVLFFGSKIYSLFNSKNEELEELRSIPKEFPKEVLDKKAEDALKNDKFYNMINKVIKVIPHTVGDIHRNKVYEYVVEPYHTDIRTGRYTIYHIIINAHYPEKQPAVLPNPSDEELQEAINSVGEAIEKKMKTVKTKQFNPMTGVALETEESTPTEDKTTEEKQDEKEAFNNK
jgi:hypothetical protein